MRGKLREAISNRILHVGIVGIELNGFAGQVFELSGQLEQKFLDRWMYRTHGLDAAAPGPIRRILKRLHPTVRHHDIRKRQRAAVYHADQCSDAMGSKHHGRCAARRLAQERQYEKEAARPRGEGRAALKPRS